MAVGYSLAGLPVIRSMRLPRLDSSLKWCPHVRESSRLDSDALVKCSQSGLLLRFQKHNMPEADACVICSEEDVVAGVMAAEAAVGSVAGVAVGSELGGVGAEAGVEDEGNLQRAQASS